VRHRFVSEGSPPIPILRATNCRAPPTSADWVTAQCDADEDDENDDADDTAGGGPAPAPAAAPAVANASAAAAELARISPAAAGSARDRRGRLADAAARASSSLPSSRAAFAGAAA